jgi:hypothetical protein
VTVIGICHLCGERKPLTFEHVPRRAFNDFPRFHFHTREYVAHRYQGGPAPTIIQDSRGAGAYTLCGSCNNRCSRYAQHFIDWAVFWRVALDSNPAAVVVTATHMTRRSRVMKQICTPEEYAKNGLARMKEAESSTADLSSQPY